MENINIMIDISGSMSEEFYGKRKIDIVKENLISILKENRFKSIRLGVFTYQYKKIGDYNNLETAIESIENINNTFGLTKIWDSIIQNIDDIEDNTIILCFTDEDSINDKNNYNKNDIENKLKDKTNVKLEIILHNSINESKEEMEKINIRKQNFNNLNQSIEEIIEKELKKDDKKLKISVPIIPLIQCNNYELEIIKDGVKAAIEYLEDLTQLRYYPVPTYIVDEYKIIITNPSKNKIEENPSIESIRNFLIRFVLNFHSGRYSEYIKNNCYSDYTNLSKEILYKLIAYSEGSLNHKSSDNVFIEGISNFRNLINNHYDNTITIISILEKALKTYPDIKVSDEYFKTLEDGILYLEKERYLNLEDWKKYCSKREFEIIINSIENGFYKLELKHILAVFKIAVRIVFNEMKNQRELYSKYPELIKERETFGVYLHPNVFHKKFEEIIIKEQAPKYLAHDNNGKVLICLGHIMKFAKQYNFSDTVLKKFITSIIIHEHTHAIIKEGVSDLKIEVKNKLSDKEYLIYNESFAEWSELNYFRNDIEMTEIIYEHITSGDLPEWKYRGALNIEKKSGDITEIIQGLLEKDKIIYKKIFNTRNMSDFESIMKDILEKKSGQIEIESKKSRTDFFYYPIELNKKIKEYYNSKGNSIGFRVRKLNEIISWEIYKNKNFEGKEAKEFYQKINGKNFKEQIINTKNKQSNAAHSTLLENSKWIDLKITSINDMKQELNNFINESINFSKEIEEIIKQSYDLYDLIDFLF